METSYTQGSDLVPIGTAAKMLGVSVGTVRRWEAADKIKSTRTAGGQRRYDVAEIQRVRDSGDSE